MDIEVQDESATDSEDMDTESICEVADLEVEIEGPEYKDLEHIAKNDPQYPRIFIPSELGTKWSDKLETISMLWLIKYKSGMILPYSLGNNNLYDLLGTKYVLLV